jgi:hypothetical protein
MYIIDFIFCMMILFCPIIIIGSIETTLSGDKNDR